MNKLQHSDYLQIIEMKQEDEKTSIYYSYYQTQFGKGLIGNTEKGVCFFAFSDDELFSLNDLKKRYPKASLKNEKTNLQQEAMDFLNLENTSKLNLHLKGTDFQMRVWKALLNIPLGKLSTYGEISDIINNPKAHRAVGTAIGSNPVAFLIPCHRVVQSSGKLGGFRWGTDLKQRLIDWENKK